MWLFLFERNPDMNLTINGEQREIENHQNVRGLLKELDIEGKHIAVAVNMQIVPRDQFESTRLAEGDKVEIVHAVGGG